MSIKRFSFELLLLVAIHCFILSENIYSQTFHPAWSVSDLKQMESYTINDKLVGTHYFYWYDYPYHHFYDNSALTDDALQDHFPKPERVSFNSTAWHQKQLKDCQDAGIDFILPVYWGVPGNYFKPDIAFSVQGLGPLQRARDEYVLNKQPSPKIAMFYDTSTLLPNIRGETGRQEKYDLRSDPGKEIFYQTIRDFFYQIHPRHWAAIDGRPIVVLYGSSFATYHDQSTFDFVYEQFKKDFHGVKPYIIRDFSWNAETDAVTQWGAALSGPKIFDQIAQIGPGYNDTPVPGRSTPIRERENGNFYKWSWNQVLKSDVQIVLIETWNEMHEGTSICHSKEYGKTYIELTSQYANRFKKNLGPSKSISLQHKHPVPRSANNWGMEYQNQQEVGISFHPEINAHGIRLVSGQADGPFEWTELGGIHALQSENAGVTYLYFDVADPFLFDTQDTVEIEYTYWDAGHRVHSIQYDSHDTKATLQGAYKSTASVASSDQKQWVTRSLTISDARFVNRENGGSDFRFVVHDGWLAIKKVIVKK